MPTLVRDDVTLYYEQSGEGLDIVWLPPGDYPGSVWRQFQTPAFDSGFRNTTYDARGVGATESRTAPPWAITDLGRDCAALIEAAADPPVILVGLSMGSLIAQQVCFDRPDLVRCAVLMGTSARKTGFIREWEAAEIAFRRAGGELSKDFATIHYAFLMYPAEVLGDDELWARVRPIVEQEYGERDGLMLAAQWEACLEYDSLQRLDSCQVPLHVIAFSQDVQTPPARGKQVADAAPLGHFHLLEGLGHGSAFGHRPEVVNACIRQITASYR